MLALNITHDSAKCQQHLCPQGCLLLLLFCNIKAFLLCDGESHYSQLRSLGPWAIMTSEPLEDSSVTIAPSMGAMPVLLIISASRNSSVTKKG